MKKYIGVKSFYLLLVFIILICNFNSVFAASKTELNNEQKDIDAKINEAKEDLKHVEKDKSAALNAISKLTDQISGYENEIDDLNGDITDLDKAISGSQTKLNEAQNEYVKQEELLNQRLIAIYEAGDISYLDVLLSSSSITDFISNYYLVSELASYDTELLEKIDSKRREIEKAKKDLEDSKSKIEIAKKNKQTKSNELKAAKTDKDGQVAKLNAEEKQIQSDLDEFAADKRAIQKELARLAAIEKQQNSNSGNNTSNVTNNPSSSGFIKPVVGYSITTGFYGYSGHTGVDYSGSGISGKPILAVKSGTVVTSTALKNASGAYKSYGEYIVINHHDGTMTLYAHGAPGSRKVSEGQKVTQGQTIMNVGTTGNSTGYHLHFEVLINGKPVNPVPYLPK